MPPPQSPERPDAPALGEAPDALQQRLDRLFEGSPLGIVFSDLEGRFLHANAAFCAMTGWTAETLQTLGYQELTPEEDLAITEGLVRGLLDNPQVGYQVRQRCRTADGQLLPIEVFGSAVVNAAGEAEMLIAQIVNRSADVEAFARLEDMANRDWVTGLHNRRYLTTLLAKHLEPQTIHHSSPSALVLIDLSGFNQVITLGGHPAGDKILREVSYLLLRPLHSEDELIRLGGDRFVALCHAETEAALLARAEAMTAEVAAHPFVVEEIEMRLVATAGLRMVRPQDRDPDMLLADVDAAARSAKERDRGSVRVFTPGDRAIVREARQAFHLKRLHEAVDQAQFAQVVEPLVHARRGGVAGYEVLTRLRDADGQLQSIGPYMAAAERAHTAAGIDLRILADTLPKLARRCRQPDPPGLLTVNLSACSLQAERFIEQLGQLLAAYRLPRGILCIEVTETAAVHQLELMHRAARMIRAEGAQLVIDDFGSGFSSLGALMALEPGGLKIDRSLVQRIHTDPFERRVVRSLVQLGHSLGAFVVLEGVETVDHLKVAQELEADYLQGYAFGKALPLDALLS